MTSLRNCLSCWLSRRPVRKSARSRPAVEVLEGRVTPAILFAPQYGAETASGPAANGDLLSSPDLHLVFWGSYWSKSPSNPSLGDVQKALGNLVSSSYLGGLTEYGSDGKATYDSTKDVVNKTDPPQNFHDADIQAVVDDAIAYLAANQGVPTPDVSPVPPLYLVITPPGINSDVNGASGYNTYYFWGRGKTPTSYAWVGENPGGQPPLDDVSAILSHEIAERMSAGNGPGNGITVTHGALWTGGGDNQVADAEAQNYSYREANGTLVQSFWSQRDQAYTVPTGQKQDFRFDPGSGVLTVNGDQLGTAYADQIDVRTTAAGALQVTLNGEVALFENPAYSSEPRVTAVRVNTGGGADTVQVDGSVTVPVSVDNSAHNLVKTVQANGTVVYTVPLPDLTPYTPPGWDGPLVVSTHAGSTTQAAVTTADTVYVDWAVINQGAGTVANAFHTELLLDGNAVKTWNTNPPLNPNDYTYVQDYSLGQLATGPHTVKLIADSQNEVTESDKTNNTATYSFTVAQALPDLAPYTPSGWGGPLVVSTEVGSTTQAAAVTTADTVYVDWSLVNQGGAAVTNSFQTELLLDGNVVQTWTTNPPLNPGQHTALQDYKLGQLAAGKHTLTLVADSLNQVTESDKSNNTTGVTFTVSQPPAITSAGGAAFVVGTAGTFTVTATGLPVPALSETGALPQGLSFHDNGDGTATLSGTPAAGSSGTYLVTFTAANAAGGIATQSFTLTVDPGPPPAIAGPSNIGSLVAVQMGALTPAGKRGKAHGRFRETVTIVDSSPDVIRGPFALVLSSLAPHKKVRRRLVPLVTLTNANGITQAVAPGSPFVVGTGAELPPSGEVTFVLNFQTKGPGNVSFTPIVLAGYSQP